MHATTPVVVSTESQVVSVLSKITDTLSQLSTRVEKIESSPSVSTVTAQITQSNQAPRSDETVPIFGMPAFTAAVSTNIDLSQKNILWAKVESAGVAIPLHIDSCCSVRLVSEAHANHAMKQCPTLTSEHLSTTFPVTVASPDAQLKAIGTMQILIKFGPGTESLFVCLVVSHLCWPMLFRHNHFQSTHELVDLGNLQITFRHPRMKFLPQCRSDNPLSCYSSLASPAPISSQNVNPAGSATATVTCLLTGMPSPVSRQKPITLHRGINLITVCLLLSTPFLQSPQPNNYWLQENKLVPGIHTLSSPIDLQQLPQDFTLDFRETGNPVNTSDMKLTLSRPTNPRCQYSKPLQPLGDPPPNRPIMFAELSFLILIKILQSIHRNLI